MTTHKERQKKKSKRWARRRKCSKCCSIYAAAGKRYEVRCKFVHDNQVHYFTVHLCETCLPKVFEPATVVLVKLRGKLILSDAQKRKLELQDLEGYYGA